MMKNILIDLNEVSYNNKTNADVLFQEYLSLEADYYSNNIDFACVAAAFLRADMIKHLFLTDASSLSNLLSALPSQFRTLICLDKFNSLTNEYLKTTGNTVNYELIYNQDYTTLSKTANENINVNSCDKQDIYEIIEIGHNEIAISLNGVNIIRSNKGATCLIDSNINTGDLPCDIYNEFNQIVTDRILAEFQKQRDEREKRKAESEPQLSFNF